MDNNNQKIALANQDRETGFSVFSNSDNFELAKQMAKCLNSSTLVPAAYQGADKLSNCMIALDVSARLGLTPLVVMQSLYIVKGIPSFSGQFIIALVNSSGLYKTRLKFEQIGEYGKDSFGYIAYAYDFNGDKITGPAVTMEMAKKEGWFDKNPKWKNMPDLMLRYRSGAFFQRSNCPELTFGIYTKEEVDELDDKAQDLQTIDIDAIPVENSDDVIFKDIPNSENNAVINNDDF